MSEHPRTEYEVTMWRSTTLPEWLAKKELLYAANRFNFEGKLRVIDDHATVRSWTWDIECVKNSLQVLIENGSISRYNLRIEKEWQTFGTGKLTDFFK